MFKNTVLNSLQCCGLWDPACCSRGGILAEILPASKQYTTVYMKYITCLKEFATIYTQYLKIYICNIQNIKYLDW